MNVDPAMQADLERRFGGLRRLYGDAAYERLRAARVAVVGVGGVGSWAAEALARSGVAALVLIDLDHVAESNINRQVQALGRTLGQAKVQALRERVADIHPGCAVHGVEEFVDERNWPALLPTGVDAVIDACDQVRAKAAMAAWALAGAQAFVSVGAAGGKRRAQAVDIEDLAQVTHDPLLASLRQRLRREHGAAGQGRMGLPVARIQFHGPFKESNRLVKILRSEPQLVPPSFQKRIIRVHVLGPLLGRQFLLSCCQSHGQGLDDPLVDPVL